MAHFVSTVLLLISISEIFTYGVNWIDPSTVYMISTNIGKFKKLVTLQLIHLVSYKFKKIEAQVIKDE